MARVSSVIEIKAAIKSKDTVLIATNDKTKFILLAATKLPKSVFAASATAAVISAGAGTAVSAACAITTGQVWAIIAIAGLIGIIGILRANSAHISGNWKTGEFQVHYDGMKN